MGFSQGDGSAVLVLWDIDHTLIETRGIGRAAFGATGITVAQVDGAAASVAAGSLVASAARR